MISRCSLLSSLLVLLALAGCKPAREPDPATVRSAEPSPRVAELAEREPDSRSEVEAPVRVQGGGTEAVRESDPGDVSVPGTVAGAAGLVQYELRYDRAAFRRLNASPFANETCPAVFLAEGETYDGVRLRYRGQWARSWPKKPLKVVFAKDQPFQGYGALNLNSGWRDPAFIREVLAYHVYAACGAPAPKSRMVRLMVNGQFEGIYVEVEQPKKQFLARLGLKGAAVYKALGRSNMSDERDLGPVSGYAGHYEKETRESEGYDDLQRFCHGLATDADVAGYLERNVDTRVLVNYLAAGVLVQNWDGFNKNHHLIRDVEGSGKWFPTPWDVDRTFGDHWNWSFDAYDLPVLLGTRKHPGVTGWNRLTDKFLAQPKFRAAFLDRLDQLTRTEFTAERLFPVIDRWAAQIARDAAVDRARWRGGAASLNVGIAQLKRFIENRRSFVQREVAALRRG